MSPNNLPTVGGLVTVFGSSLGNRQNATIHFNGELFAFALLVRLHCSRSLTACLPNFFEKFLNRACLSSQARRFWARRRL